MAKELLQFNYGVQDPSYWMYQGKTLTELRKEKEHQALIED